jgi:hypothetical protein
MSIKRRNAVSIASPEQYNVRRPTRHRINYVTMVPVKANALVPRLSAKGFLLGKPASSKNSVE